jgi:hypothetical protein
MEPQASLLVTAGIPALALAVLVALGVAVARVAPRGRRRRHVVAFVAGAAAWLGYTTALAASGVLASDGLPPRMLLLLPPLIALPVWIARSPLGARLAGMPVAWLVAFHAFRLPLELVMHAAAAEGTMPAQMTYTGYNLDIVTGATAVVVGGLAWAGRAPRGLLVAWNALGTALLAAIVAISVASLPAFRAFGDEPAAVNSWVAHPPFHLLPAVLVASALLGHLVLWRRLASPHRSGVEVAPAGVAASLRG